MKAAPCSLLLIIGFSIGAQAVQENRGHDLPRKTLASCGEKTSAQVAIYKNAMHTWAEISAQNADRSWRQEKIDSVQELALPQNVPQRVFLAEDFRLTLDLSSRAGNVVQASASWPSGNIQVDFQCVISN